ncbi:unnamed protein product [Gongylonema pulchrum]|uniref:Uncharacterized protein n=1 Tax=Gongylonema pulchrum TaxID=637853 RepID=A0A3P7LXX1_9BILA|nr:unnamed protein product [Gongylonema pulchrum]
MLRLYLPMMAVAYTNNNYAQVVRLGACLLKDIEKRLIANGNNVTPREKSLNLMLLLARAGMDSMVHTCLSWMVKALIELGRSQVIMGLYTWTEKYYGQRFDWVKCSAEMASGRIETALCGLQKLLHGADLPENVQKTCRQLIIMGLEMLRNPDEISRFRPVIQEDSTTNPDALPEGFEEIAWKR